MDSRRCGRGSSSRAIRSREQTVDCDSMRREWEAVGVCMERPLDRGGRNG